MNCKYALGKTEIRFLFTSSRRGEWLASTFSISTSSAHSWFNLQPLRSQAYLCPPLSWCWRFLPVPALWKLLQTASRSHYLALLKKKKSRIPAASMTSSQVITVPLKHLCVLTSTTSCKLPGLNSSQPSSLSSLWFYGFSMGTRHYTSQPLNSVFPRLQNLFLHHPNICMTNPPYPGGGSYLSVALSFASFSSENLPPAIFSLYFFSTPLLPTRTEALWGPEPLPMSSFFWIDRS